VFTLMIVHACGTERVRKRQLGPIALMCADVGAVRAWVLDVLGDLGIDDEGHRRLRETLWEFLSAGGSFTAVAERLLLHRNTVRYRIRRAEDALGHGLESDRLNIEVALLACRWLGPAVLRPPART
jgi:DNA-binding PucR family transcriptional regulator